MYKRKRSTTRSYNKPYRAPYKKRTFVKGKDRVGGYYGRFPQTKTGELKFFDLDLNDPAISQTGMITESVNEIAQGVTESTRIGRKCTVKSIHWRYRLSIPAVDAGASLENSGSVRLIMYVDKQCNGATATVADILEQGSIRSFRNLANQGRFTTICDKVVNLAAGAPTSDGVGVVSQPYNPKNLTFFKGLNLPLEFSSITGVISEIRSNNIGVLLIGDQGNEQITSRIRVRYSD